MVRPTSPTSIERTEPPPTRKAFLSNQVSAGVDAHLATALAAHLDPSHASHDHAVRHPSPILALSPPLSPPSVPSHSKPYPRPLLANVAPGGVSASTSSHAARHSDLSRPAWSSNAPATLAPSLPTTTNSSGSQPSPSASVESLRSLLIRSDSDLTRRASQLLVRPPWYGPTSRASSEPSTTLAPLPDTEHTPLITRSSQSVPTRQEQDQQQQQSDDAKGDMNALRWGHWWWPFSVVGPSAPTPITSTATLKPDLESEEQRQQQQTRSFLSYFAGRPAVDEIAQQHLSQKRADDLERDMLDLAPDELATVARSVGISGRARRIYREADEDSPKGATTPASQGPDRPRSFISNALDGHASLLSSFSISNPFGPRATRTFSTSSFASDAQTRRKMRHDEDEDNIEPMLNQEDQEAVDDSHMDIYTVLKESYRCPEHPIVFCHGLFGFDMLGPTSIKPLRFSYWVGVKEALEGLGVEVMIAKVPASDSIEERAKVLCLCIEERFPGKQVNLIGHSMGGLDGRFLITHLRPTSFSVRSLTTISSPHRGSSFADFMLEDVIGQQHLPKLLSLVETVGIPGGGRAFEDLTVSKMARFNEQTPDREDVAYYSYGAEFVPTWTNVFRVPYGILLEKEGPNDGLVSVRSAKWGNYQATLNNVNHLDLIGWVGKVRYGWAEWLGRPIKFKPVSFFCAVAEMLAEEGH
ncbi:BQ5605_C011g06527 [Microbotryum silenes-dioicae]|uniref:GPI inositol-deacylase n=1 Tax=Microbotryum silenes-dioicae TaxID=796604 RepID=A0A2X0MII0_9BASI|nr:BQ5605_C011g06527 [Microbotryum silenes-dioicae]